MILTNKYDVNYNFENINRDFDIFAVEKESKKLDQTNVLDLATLQYKARAVQYTYGRTAYVLFDKGAVTEKAYKDTISTDYEDVTVRKVDVETENFFYQKRLLAQLLMNSIRIPTGMGFSYNNISGKLLYGNPDWIMRDRKTGKPFMMYFLNVNFDIGMYLNLDVKTYSTRSGRRKGIPYIMDPKTGIFRKKLATDPYTEELFTESSFKSKKNTVPYLDFSSIDAFKKCKLGIHEKVLQDVKKYLGAYMELIPEYITDAKAYDESLKEKESLSNIDYASILNERGINIVDECFTETSDEMKAWLVQEFKSVYGITVHAGSLEKEMFNIRLIHSEEYYDETEEHDPYKDDTHGFIVQHMIVEEISGLKKRNSKGESAVFKKIVTELILKGDVRARQVSIYNWPKLSYGKPWTFVQRTAKREFDPEQNRQVSYFMYYSVQIDEKGGLTFKVFDDRQISKDHLEERIRAVYDTYSDFQKWKHGKTVEALVFSDIENIQVIIRTNRKTMPNIHNIWDGLSETNAKNAIITSVVLEALESFREVYPQHSDYVDLVKKEIQNYGSSIIIKDLKKICHIRKKDGGLFHGYLHENYGILLSAELRAHKNEEQYAFGNITNIKYYIDDNTDNTGTRSFNYFAGEKRKGMRTSIHTACIVRQIQAEKEIEFGELLGLLAVDFIRVGAYTVLPFPFKYLREYQKMIE